MEGRTARVNLPSILCDPDCAAMVDDFDGQGVEELVGKNYEAVARLRMLRSPASRRLRRDQLRFGRTAVRSGDREMSATARPAGNAGRERIPGNCLADQSRTSRGKKPRPGTEFDQVDAIGRTEHTPHLLELARQQATKHGVNVAGSIEVTAFAELLGRSANSSRVPDDRGKAPCSEKMA